MSLFDSLASNIRKSQEEKDSSTKCLPFADHRLRKLFPGPMKGLPTIITSTTSGGKTTFAKSLFVYHAIDSAVHSGLEIKIIYLCLEESKHQFECSVLSYVLATLKKVRLDIKDFDAMGSSMSEDELSLLNDPEVKKQYDKYMSRITLIDHLHTVPEIYGEVMNMAWKRGKFFDSKGQLIMQPTPLWKEYRPDNPNEVVMVICDHLGKLRPSKGETQWDAIQRYSDYNQSTFCNRLGWYGIMIQQQAKELESLESLKADRWMPTINTLGVNKTTADDARLIVGIGHPSRYKIKNFEGYEVHKFQGMIRFMTVLKNTYGEVDKVIGFFFDGRTGVVEPLPPPSDTATLEKYYKYIDSL